MTKSFGGAVSESTHELEILILESSGFAMMCVHISSVDSAFCCVCGAYGATKSQKNSETAEVSLLRSSILPSDWTFVARAFLPILVGNSCPVNSAEELSKDFVSGPQATACSALLVSIQPPEGDGSNCIWPLILRRFCPLRVVEEGYRQERPLFRHL